VQISPRGRHKVDFDELKGRLGSNFSVTTNSYLLRTEIEGCEFALFPDGRAIIKGTDDFSVAKTLYSKYIGN
jgi:adenylyltransferase/sulfurtransferase